MKQQPRLKQQQRPHQIRPLPPQQPRRRLQQLQLRPQPSQKQQQRLQLMVAQSLGLQQPLSLGMERAGVPGKPGQTVRPHVEEDIDKPKDLAKMKSNGNGTMSVRKVI